MTIRKIARTDVITVSPSETAQVAGQRLEKTSVGSLVVVDDGALVGLLTDRDLALRVVAQGRDPTTTLVDEVMSVPVHTLDATVDVEDAIDALANHGVRRMPVTDDGELFGILTLDDLLGVKTAEFALLESVILAQSTRASMHPAGGSGEAPRAGGRSQDTERSEADREGSDGATKARRRSRDAERSEADREGSA